MKLENLALEMPKLKGEVKVYQLVDLAYMSPAGLYGSGDVQLGVGKCIPRFNSDKDLNGEFKLEPLPTYGTPSKLYLEGQELPFPALRYDPADNGHKVGHLHVGGNEEGHTFPAIPNLSGEEARQIYIKALFESWNKEKK